MPSKGRPKHRNDSGCTRTKHDGSIDDAWVELRDESPEGVVRFDDTTYTAPDWACNQCGGLRRYIRSEYCVGCMNARQQARRAHTGGSLGRLEHAVSGNFTAPMYLRDRAKKNGRTLREERLAGWLKTIDMLERSWAPEAGWTGLQYNTLVKLQGAEPGHHDRMRALVTWALDRPAEVPLPSQHEVHAKMRELGFDVDLHTSGYDKLLRP